MSMFDPDKSESDEIMKLLSVVSSCLASSGSGKMGEGRESLYQTS